MNASKNKILVSALEPSANLHLEEILRHEAFEIIGIFDERFGTPLYSSREFSVMGFIDVLPKIAKAKEAIAELAFLSQNVDKVLLIDAPSFNLPLAKAIKKINPKCVIIYYILPKVWAWKKRRIRTVKKYVDKTAYIFPFEKEYWGDGYVGNPLLDELTEFREEKETGVIAFLAGSRKSEVLSLMPIFRELAQKIEKKALLVIPPSLKENKELYGDISGFELCYNTSLALQKSDFAYICSGTATLEAAIVGTPFVLIYKARALEYFIAKQLVKLRYVGLANILFEKEGLDAFHTEYLQTFDVPTLLQESSYTRLEEFQKKSRKIREILAHGSSEKVVALLKEK